MTAPHHPIFHSSAIEFVAGVATLEQLIETSLPEIAFAGRSNVGKSSLINALTGRKALARTSNTPGRTQQLNFFDIGGMFHLVDMPGYGYAQVSRQTKSKWEKLIRSYLRGRTTLRCAFVLVDARHGLKPSDEELMTLLDETAVPYRVILTKIDKVRGQLAERDMELLTALKKHPAAWPKPYISSATEKDGIPELQDVILDLIA